MDLNYKTYGSGDVVVILHGLFGMSDNWKTIANRLADEYTVVLPDLPNHGRSPRLPEFSPELAAESVYDFLHENRIYHARIVGHSLGGKIAMNLALKFPEACRQLVSVDISPRAYLRGHDEIFKALFSLDPNQISSRAEADEQLARHISNQGIRLFLLKNLKRKDSGFEWKFDLDTLHRDYDSIVQQVKSDHVFEAPTLFLGGEQSDYLNRERDLDSIHDLFPNAELRFIAGAGHWVHADKPNELEEELRRFFSQN